GRAPRARNAAEKFLTPLPPPSLEMDQAAMLTVYFEGVRQQYLKQREREWRYATGATMVGSLTSLSSVLPSFPIFLWQGLSFDPPNQLYLSYLGDYDMGPPEALLLAVRAARRGAAENPDDLQACRILERATTALALAQENHWARSRARPALSADQLRELREARRPIDAGALPWLTRAVNFRQLLRRIQVLTALHHGLLVEPNDLLAHAQLAELYWSMSFYDLAVEHLREQVRLMRVEEKERSDPQRKAELAQWEQLLSDRERQVNDLQRFAALQLTQAPPRHQPVLAFRYFGLARQALNDLQAQDPTQFNPEEADLLLFLHLMFGQAEQLRGQLTETQQKLLGPLEYEMYRVLQAAAVGDYAEADRALERALGPGTLQPTALPLLNMLQAMTFGQFQPHVVNRRLLAPVLQDQAQVGLRHLMHQRKMKDLEVLRGMLALETGDVDKAKKLFRQAVEQSWGIDFESRPIAMRYLQLLQ
ncbi:MAG: hypothetical protein JNM56_13965, partial [Planctomycetia bacterium]|nr:hypothetical protein [Planctomycetia bacterium]